MGSDQRSANPKESDTGSEGSDGVATAGGVTRPPYATDHVAARKFAVKWAARDSRGDIAGLARAYLLATADKDGAYRERDQCVAAIAVLALLHGWRAWLGRHVGGEWEDDWRNIVFVELPTGQVSWHVHDSELPLFSFLQSTDEPWDGHDTPEKYRRLAGLVKP